MRIINGILIFIFIALQYRLWLGEGGYRHNHNLQKKIHLQEEENIQLEDRNAQLAAEVISLQEGSEGIEEYARTQLGMIKPDETFYLIVEKQKK
jgi:cell division protein FtsB